MNILGLVFIFVIAPALAGLFSVLTSKKNLIYRFISLSLLLLNICLMYSVFKHSNDCLNFNYYYVFGGWPKNFGIEFKYNLSAGVLLSFLYTVSFVHSLFSDFRQTRRDKIFFILIAVSGFSGLILTNDIFNFYVFLEISSIGLFGIFSFNQEPGAIKALFDYIVINVIIGLLILFAIFCLYNETGNLNIDIIKDYILKNGKKNSLNLSLFIFTICCFLKSGIFPLHEVIYRIYKKHSIQTNAFVVTLSSKIYILMYYKILTIFGHSYISSIKFYVYFVEIFSLIGIIFFSFQVLSVKYLPNFINLFSISQINYLSLYILHANSEVFFYYICIGVFCNAISQLILFLLLRDIQNNILKLGLDSSYITIILNDKLFYKMLFLINLLNISGFPLSASFMTKWYIFFDFIKRDFILSFVIILIYNTVFMLLSLNLSSSILKKDSIKEKIDIRINYKLFFFGIFVSIANFLSLFLIRF